MSEEKKEEGFSFGNMNQEFTFDSSFKSDFSFDTTNMNSQFSFGEQKTEKKEEEEEEEGGDEVGSLKPEEECNVQFKPLVDLKDLPEIETKTEEETSKELFSQ
jgi:hypothetical protein